MWGERNPHALLVGMKISTTTIENSLEAPQKTKNRTAMQSSNTTPRDAQRNVSQVIIKAPAHPCLLQHYSQ
jgi:hypothetical protein